MIRTQQQIGGVEGVPAAVHRRPAVEPGQSPAVRLGYRNDLSLEGGTARATPPGHEGTAHNAGTANSGEVAERVQVVDVLEREHAHPEPVVAHTALEPERLQLLVDAGGIERDSLGT